MSMILRVKSWKDLRAFYNAIYDNLEFSRGEFPLNVYWNPSLQKIQGCLLSNYRVLFQLI